MKNSLCPRIRVLKPSLLAAFFIFTAFGVTPGFAQGRDLPIPGPQQTPSLGVYELPGFDCAIRIVSATPSQMVLTVVPNPKLPWCSEAGRSVTAFKRMDGLYHSAGLLALRYDLSEPGYPEFRESAQVEKQYDTFSFPDEISLQIASSGERSSDRASAHVLTLNSSFSLSTRTFLGTSDGGCGEKLFESAMQNAAAIAEDSGYTNCRQSRKWHEFDGEDYCVVHVTVTCRQ